MDAAEIARLDRVRSFARGRRTALEECEDILAVCDALEQEARKERDEALNDAATLAADQCQDGYGDDYGNHACKVVDAMRAQRDACMAGGVAVREQLASAIAQRDAAQQDAKEARALLGEADFEIEIATVANEDGSVDADDVRRLLCHAYACGAVARGARIEAMLEKKL